MLGSSQDLNMVAQNRRRQPSSYCYGPVVQRWTTHASLRRQAWWWRRPLVMTPLSGRVPGRASESSQIRVDDGGGYITFCGWRLGPLGFSRGCEFIGERGEVRGRLRGPHNGAAWPGGRPRHHQVWLARCSSSSPLWTPSLCQQNRNLGFCFVQFREYFLR
jgi:hypothetical protein